MPRSWARCPNANAPTRSRAARRLRGADEQALGRQLIADALDADAREALAAGRPVRPPEEDDALTQAVFDALFRLGRLQRLLDDPSVENINANGADQVWVRYADGRRERTDPIAASDEELIELVRNAAARLGIGERRFDLGSPRLSLQLPDGSRLFAVMAVAARPCLSIRRHRYMKVTPDDLVGMGTLDLALRELLRSLMLARKSVIICGGTGAGKTTLLRAMAADIPPWERLVTIEDSLELGLDRYPELHPDVVALEAREPNLEGEGGISLAELVRWALRLNPDRVIVGEARGEEVLALLNAMSQGTDGSMATLHASSSKGAFSKLATYAVQAPERLPLEATNLLVANAVHFVVFLAQDPAGRRFVSSVREVVDADGPMVVSNEVFRPGPDGRAVPGVQPAHRHARRAGRGRLRPRTPRASRRVVGTMTALGVLLGAGAGLGVALIALGLRGVEARRQTDKVTRARVERHTLRLAIAVGAAVLVGAVTGWPVAALLAAAACWGVPALFTESKAQATTHRPGRGGGGMGRDAARHHGRRGRPGAGHRRHRHRGAAADPPGRGDPGRSARTPASGAGSAGLRRRRGRPDLRPGGRRVAARRRAPSQPTRGAARHPGHHGPRPSHDAPSGRGGAGADPHLGQSHRRNHPRSRPVPRRVEPRLPRPLRQRRRPARPARWWAGCSRRPSPGWPR